MRSPGIHGLVTFSSRKSGCCSRVNSTAKPPSIWRTTRPGVFPSVIKAPIGGTVSLATKWPLESAVAEGRETVPKVIATVSPDENPVPGHLERLAMPGCAHDPHLLAVDESELAVPLRPDAAIQPQGVGASVLLRCRRGVAHPEHHDATQQSAHAHPERAQQLVYAEMENNRQRVSGVHIEQQEASIPDQISDLAKLRDQGVLTDAEFQAKKAELLSRM